MPRDPSRNVYVTIGIPRDSATYDALVADSAETGLTLAQLIATRIADWYRLGAGAPPIRTATRADQAATDPPVAVSADRGLQARAAQAAAAWAADEE